MAEARPWQNRILRHAEEPPESLLANPLNWRIHPKAQQDALTDLVDRVGWVQSVIVNERTQNVVDGHLRVSLAISRGEPTVPVIYVDLTEEEERLVLASFDPLAAMAVMDAEQLRDLLGGLDVGDGAMGKLVKGLAQDASDRLHAQGGMPNLDDLPDAPINEEDFWPVIRVKVPPDLQRRFAAAIETRPEKTEWEKLRGLLGWGDG